MAADEMKFGVRVRRWRGPLYWLAVTLYGVTGARCFFGLALDQLETVDPGKR